MLSATVSASNDSKDCAGCNEMNRLAHRIGHDLRAPLRAMAMLPEWIAEEFEDAQTDIPPRAHKFLDLISSKAAQMEGQLAGLLEYALLGEATATVCSVDISSELTNIAQKYLDDGAYEIEVAPDVSTLMVAREDFQALFSHLISNAVLHNDQPDPHVRVTAHLDGSMAIFRVEDNGPGIKEEDHQRIFEPFEILVARDSAKGCGLGLAVVQKIADRWKGRITVRSELGQGACFEFQFPVEECDPAPQ